MDTCQICHRNSRILKALGKYSVVQGYPQCGICGGDLMAESVVIRQIHFDRNRNDGVPLPDWLEKDLRAKGLLDEIPANEVERCREIAHR